MIKFKKAKYKFIKIKKKKYYFYTIEWMDIVGDAGHATSEEFNNMIPAAMTTHAYVYSNDRKAVRTFSSYDNNDEVFSDRNVFPKGCIKKMRRTDADS
tara:strand:+ start:492 stop:785 length:294 start_codon:yes stop_codon:yes gene_type:complete